MGQCTRMPGFTAFGDTFRVQLRRALSVTLSILMIKNYCRRTEGWCALVALVTLDLGRSARRHPGFPSKWRCAQPPHLLPTKSLYRAVL